MSGGTNQYSGKQYADRMEGMEVVKYRPLVPCLSKRDLWAVTVAKLYMRALKTGEVPNYPSEPDPNAKRGMI